MSQAKKMDDGGVVEGESPIMTAIRNYVMKHHGDASNDQADNQVAQNVDTSSDTAKGYADGGPVMDPKDVIGLPGVPPPATPMSPVVAAGLPGVPALPGMQPTDDEKKEIVKKALRDKTLKMDDGGAVDPSQLPSAPSDAPPVDPQQSKLQAIIQAISQAGKQAASPITDLLSATQTATAPVAVPVAKATAPVIVPALNRMLGTDVPNPVPAPTPDAIAPVPPPATPTPNAATAMPSPSAAPSAASQAPAADPLAALGQSDPTAVAPGLNPGDRQALANQNIANQHTFGNYLAQAVAGIGDAVAARGGVQQNALGSILSLQKQQRDEALNNFDKAREIAMQNRTMKMQADQALIENVKAKNELGPLPDSITAATGLPKGTTPSQASILMGMNNAKIEHQDKAAQLQLDSAKQASDEWEHLPVTQRMLGGASNQSSWIANRTNDLMNKAMGNVKVTDGKNTGYVSPQDYQHARATNPNIQQVPF